MDGERFDRLARTFAVGSRRGLLKSALGVALGSVLARTGLEPAAAATPAGAPPGALCNRNSHCASGVCLPRDRAGRRRCSCGDVAACPQPAPGDQCRKAVCSAGICSLSVLFGQPCDDRNACTTGDSCDALGECVGEPIVCAASDQCHETGVCDPATGQCSNPAKPDDASCDDGDLCTVNDICTGGVCAGTPVTCNQDANPCTVAACDPGTGNCVNSNLEDGTACDDGSASTCNDVCVSGVCTGTTVNLQTDRNNCGSCGNACPAFNLCVAGQCANPCNPSPCGTSCFCAARVDGTHQCTTNTSYISGGDGCTSDTECAHGYCIYETFSGGASHCGTINNTCTP